MSRQTFLTNFFKLLEIKAQKGGILQTGWKRRGKEQDNIDEEQEPVPKTYLIWSRFQLPQPLKRGELTKTFTFSEISNFVLDNSKII